MPARDARHFQNTAGNKERQSKPGGRVRAAANQIGGCDRGRCGRRRPEAGGGDGEALDALTGDLTGRVVEEGVQEVAVVLHLMPVAVREYRDLSGRPFLSGREGGQRWPQFGQGAAYL